MRLHKCAGRPHLSVLKDQNIVSFWQVKWSPTSYCLVETKPGHVEHELKNLLIPIKIQKRLYS